MIHFCSQCGAKTAMQVPVGDQLTRSVCQSCGHIHYENPRLIALTIPLWQGQVLLCRRGIEPRLGFWTLPGGFMENGESTQESACRETWEEACCQVNDLALHAVVSLPFCNQVHLFYRANMCSPEWQLTPESTEIALFTQANLPWQELAFGSVQLALEHHFAVAAGLAQGVLDVQQSKPRAGRWTD